MLIDALSNAGILALASMAVVLAPLFMGVAYAIKPSEARLALMRPLSLAAIFRRPVWCGRRRNQHLRRHFT
jgi:hypothetical protein